jgi:hypothetical protein
VLWLVLALLVLRMNESDVAGNSLSYSFAVLTAIALWVLLVVVALMAGWKTAPGWLRGTGVLLYPLSCAATIAAIELVRGRGSSPFVWAAIVPVLLPPLLMLTSAPAFVPWLRSRLSEDVREGVWVGILVLSLLPWPFLLLQSRDRAARQARLRDVAATEARPGPDD